MPKARFRASIAAFMALVLAIGVILWALLPWIEPGTPTPAEAAALADCRMARLRREVAEYALAEYDMDSATLGTSPIDELGRAVAISADVAAIAARREREEIRESLKRDIAGARAEERARQAAYDRERARRRQGTPGWPFW